MKTPAAVGGPGRLPDKGSRPGRQVGSKAGPRWAGTVLILIFAAYAAAPLAALLLSLGASGGFLPSLGRAISAVSTRNALSFALRQALASTAVALVVGLPGAWLSSRYAFPGRRTLKALSAVPFCMPPILIVLAFVVYYGRGGILNRALMAVFGLREPPLTFLYSFWGLVLVHGFYNFPIVLQGVGAAMAGIPRDREEVARTLGAGPIRAFVTGRLPSIAPAIVQSATLVFLFCFFSFIVVLVFGPIGGTTLEVEIYRAARFKGDQGLAAALSIIETVVALAMVFLFQLAEKRGIASARHAGGDQVLARPHGLALGALLSYAAILGLFFAGPLLSLAAQAFVVRQGMGGAWRFGIDNFARLLGPGGHLLPSMRDTALVALPAALLATVFGSLLAVALRERQGGRLAEAVVSLPLAVSGVVCALGWSIMAPQGGIGVVVLALAAAALPFSLRAVSASLATLDPSPGMAARTLGASRTRTALDIELPAVAPAIAAAAAFSFSITAGDANAPLLLGQGGFEPLPLLIYRLVAAYRFPEASAVGLTLALLTGFVFFVKERNDGRA